MMNFSPRARKRELAFPPSFLKSTRSKQLGSDDVNAFKINSARVYLCVRVCVYTRTACKSEEIDIRESVNPQNKKAT